MFSSDTAAELVARKEKTLVIRYAAVEAAFEVLYQRNIFISGKHSFTGRIRFLLIGFKLAD